jgi:CheY-like chemotaxis protein
VFTVALPLRRAPTPHPATPHEPDDASPRGVLARQVLVVDDDEAYRHVLSAMLQGIADHVLEARNGAEALDILARTVPNLVLLDLRMPGIDGAQVLARIAEEPAFRDVPVVVTTSARLDSTVLERTALARAVVPKASLTPHTLRELVAAHAGGTS